MFVGFNVGVNDKEKFYSYYNKGLLIYNKHKRAINSNSRVFLQLHPDC